MKLHYGHNVLRIDDEESLYKNNISIENSIQEYDADINKLNTLKGSIEFEMTEIDKMYEKVDKEITKSYSLKKKKLFEEEENLKNILKTEVTKMKEKFEMNLSEINNLLKVNDKLTKGTKLLTKEKDNNMIKKLSYISILTKSKKQIEKLFQEPMKNIKIFFVENENKIKYEEYYFNMEPEEENELNDEGFGKEEIETVMNEVKCSRKEAIKALRKTNGDPVEALLEFGF